jgi:hypothetical protein
MIAGVSTETRAQHFPNKILELYAYTILFHEPITSQMKAVVATTNFSRLDSQVVTATDGQTNQNSDSQLRDQWLLQTAEWWRVIYCIALHTTFQVNVGWDVEGGGVPFQNSHYGVTYHL